MQMNDYRSIVVGTDGSALAGPTVARAAWLAANEESELVIVCAWSGLSRRTEAKNTATLGGDTRFDQVHGRQAAGEALAQAVAHAHELGATVTAALLVESEPAAALLSVVEQRGADCLVVGARQDVSVAERLLGTVASEVVRKATCDVVIVRPRERTGDLVVPEDTEGVADARSTGG